MDPLYVHQTGDGPVALFVHGFPLDHTMWEAQTDALADLRTCLAPDLAGFGRSPWTDDRPLSMERHADDLARVLDAYGAERADLVGLSMGGYVAFAFLRRHGDRVRTVTLVDTRASADDEAGRAARTAAVESLRADGVAAFAKGMVPKLVAQGAPEDVRARLRATIEGTAEDTIAAALVGMRERADSVADLGAVTAPTLVICGKEDALTPPPMARAMADGIGGAELALVEGAGHMAPMEAPEEVNQLLRDFLLRRSRA